MYHRVRTVVIGQEVARQRVVRACGDVAAREGVDRLGGRVVEQGARVPVVSEGHDEQHAGLLRELDDLVEPLEAGGPEVDGGGAVGDELEPCAVDWDRVYVCIIVIIYFVYDSVVWASLFARSDESESKRQRSDGKGGVDKLAAVH